METLNVKLDTIELVKNFSTLMSAYPHDCDLTSGRYVVDAKSIMGVFSLDLTKTLELHLYGEVTPELREELQIYLEH